MTYSRSRKNELRYRNVLCVGLSLLVIGLSTSTTVQAQARPATQVAVIEAQLSVWQTQLRAVGSLRAVQEVNMAAEIGGRVERIAFDSGQAVQAGDVLVELDTRSERAELADLEAQLELALLDLRRIERLVQERNVSEADADAARSQLKRVEARLSAQKTLIDKMTLRAPFSGQLGIREVNLGEVLNPGAEVVSLQASDPIFVDFPLPQNVVSGVAVGRQVSVTIDAFPGETFKGTVQALDARVDQRSRSVTVRAALPNGQGQLRPGMFVKVIIPLADERNLITLPTSSPVYSTFGDNVFVVVKEGGAQVVKRKSVTLGERRGDQVAVLDGLEAGELVVVAGQVKLRDGMAVSIDEGLQPFNQARVSGTID